MLCNIYRTSPGIGLGNNNNNNNHNHSDNYDFNGNMGMGRDLRDAYGNGNDYGGGGGHGGGGGYDNHIELQGRQEPVNTAAAVGATIWGTDIRAGTICEIFRDFLNNFTSGRRHGDKSTYMLLLEELFT